MIENDQTGYIKSRYIGENILTVSNIIQWLNINKIPGIILQIDFEKAFDSVSWEFLIDTLYSFNFGPEFVRWVAILYHDIYSTVSNNGHTTPYFKLTRGVRQGCPLSCYLFILVVELLAIKIRHHRLINGIAVSNHFIKISQLADDTTLFLSSEEEIPHVISLMDEFANESGLRMNIDKTEGFYYNGAPSKQYGMVWPDKCIRLLGITITDDWEINDREN